MMSRHGTTWWPVGHMGWVRIVRRSFLVLLLAWSPGLVAAQEAALHHETRGVWFSPALRDGNWPDLTAPPLLQAEDLREHVRRAKTLGLNTFILQVTYNGDAIYASHRLPWAATLIGAGRDPGFDPLAVAVEEAHRLGMELHAWINVFWVGDLTTISQYQRVRAPTHVLFSHAQWLGMSGHWLWIDPSVEAAREWLIGNVLELVEKYDVDAVHFDYVRYPVGGLSGDSTAYALHKRGFGDIDDWRRDNVTQFVRGAQEAVQRVKPWVKVGSTPIGNYRRVDQWPAMWAYSDVFQESRRWLREGWNDYLTPQLYFSIGTEEEYGEKVPSPDFGYLVQEWEAESDGRPVFAGLAAYKPALGIFPADHLVRQVDAAREAGAEGHVFFRYDHLMAYADLVADRYAGPALPAPMRHREDALAPSSPGAPTAERVGEQVVALGWAPAIASAGDPLKCYAVLRRIGDEAESLLGIVGPGTFTYTDTLAASSETPSHYRMVAVSRLGAASDPSPSVSASWISLAAEYPSPAPTALHPPYPNPASGSVTLVLHLAHPGDAALHVVDLLGRRVATIVEGWKSSGRHEVSFRTDGLAGGVYLIVLETADGRLVRKLMVG